jgi:hypothetical protein
VNVDNLSNDDAFNDLKRKMGVTYQDQINISPAAFPNYEDKVNKYFAFLCYKSFLTIMSK